MEAWLDIRLAARACHSAALDKAGGNRRAHALVVAAAEIDDLQIEAFDPGTRFAPGIQGCFERIGLLVSVSSALSSGERELVIAHEIGHFKLHDDAVSDVKRMPVGVGGDSADVATIVTDGYSPQERKEVQADVFAGEFLCPADWLREELVTRRRKPSEIATELGLPGRIVVAQAIRGLLLPPLRNPQTSGLSPDRALDSSQMAAATWTGSPLLVEAGPGTGKTKTLVHRISTLLDGGAEPSRILALTFSNLAAAEMRERVAMVAKGAAFGIWIGTFHGFGLEVIAKRHEIFGLGRDFKVLDQAGALALLERNLAKLQLKHFQNLYEPAYELLPVLRAISRCKDEMLSPEAYGAEAAKALRAAVNDEEFQVAEKAVEVAMVYSVYRDALREEKSVDFGDLVMMAADLLETNAAVRGQMQDQYRHLLVDEYQDVNAAGARLLKALFTRGTDLWVVGDLRQSIYRFRGAEPANVTRFRADFGGDVRTLGWNYRSGNSVVRAIEAFSGAMAIPGEGRWTVDRGAVGSISMAVAPTIAGEAKAIRDNIERFRTAGIPYSDQAILGRSHLTLERITRMLESMDIPLLYLGDLFERPEVRDLLALVSMDAESGGIGLVRVAQLPESLCANNNETNPCREFSLEG